MGTLWIAPSKRPRSREPSAHVLWTLLVAVMPQGIGFIVYFVLRDAVLQPCRSCDSLARREYAFCPQCGVSLPRICPSCGKPLEAAWSHCAYCGVRLSEAREREASLAVESTSAATASGES